MDNFDPSEFLCPCGKCDGGTMNSDYLMKLERVRHTVGRPMHVTSAFRCQAHNKAVGGAADSMHLQGRAADILARTGFEKYMLVSAAMENGILGVGVKRDIIHLDDRITPQIWTY